MGFSLAKKDSRDIIKIIILTILIVIISSYRYVNVLAVTDDTKHEIESFVKQIFENRNRGIQSGDLELIESIYDVNTMYGSWAFDHEIKKMKYIRNWEARQGVKFMTINPKIVFQSVKENGDRVSVRLLCSTEYKYIYENQPGIVNSCKIGTHHFLQLVKDNDLWLISKEWYKDPFADSLNINTLKADTVKEFLLSQSERDFSSLNPRRIQTVEYLNKYCGVASEEQYGFKYNPNYKNYNSMGGDCANFASQTLFEAGKFRKNSAWNYENGDSTRAWVNADGFKGYMVDSGRASIIAYGNYEKVYKLSYKLLPGDFVAYEKKGDITHISVVSGADSKGYSLVSCHNTDRNKVPWDLGWSDKDIRFWLVRVHY